MTRPTAQEHAPYLKRYIDLVPELDILAALADQIGLLRRFGAALRPDKEMFAYAPGKWTVRQVCGHLADCERVFGYRAMRVARADQTPLAGFDEEAFVAHAQFNDVATADLLEELLLLRAANLRLLTPLDAAQWERMGSANGTPITPRALAYVMVGHVRHHLQLFAERYAIR